MSLVGRKRYHRRMAPSLEELIRRTGSGDKAAFAALYRQASAKLFGVALRICGSRGVAEEVLQEGFVAIWARAADYDPVRGPAMGWLATIVRHCAIDQLRRQQSRPEGHRAPEGLLESFAQAGRTDTGAELRAAAMPRRARPAAAPRDPPRLSLRADARGAGGAAVGPGRHDQKLDPARARTAAAVSRSMTPGP